MKNWLNNWEPKDIPEWQLKQREIYKELDGIEIADPVIRLMTNA